MKIELFSLHDLHNEEHLQYQNEFKDLTEKTGPASLGIEPRWPAYVGLYVQEATVMALINKSALTAELIAADNHRDELFSSLRKRVTADALHYNPDFRQAGTRLQLVIDHYGDVPRKSYDKETADLLSLTSELHSTHSADVSLLGLDGWLSELETANNNFNQLMQSRYSEDSLKTQLRMKEVRTEIDHSYLGMVEYINALIVINGQEAYEVYVNELNSRIQRYQNQIARHRGKSSAGASQQEPAI
jgi:hypothetical protein